MPDTSLGNQIFDLDFHPKEDYVYTGLLTGEIKALKYDTDGSCQHMFNIRPTKRSCRGLAIDTFGKSLWAISKDKTIHIIDANSGKIVDERLAAHESPLNRVIHLLPNMVATGDDDGVIKLWDPRQSDAIREYTQHFDFISDFLWLEDKRQLVATSGDGTLSVMDVRINKPEPLAHSEDQEDELLSIVGIKGNTKIVVGTQLGILSIFNRNKGWGDCVDRIPGHPSSIDTLCALSGDVILAGSSDGLIRAVQIFPTKFLGVLADHGEFPIERMKLDRNAKWLGSVSHDEVLKLTDVEDALEESDNEKTGDEAKTGDGDSDGEAETEEAGLGDVSPKKQINDDESDVSDSDGDRKKKKRRKKSKEAMGSRKKTDTAGDKSFFADL
ncbi:WD repeat-containing protein jip5 [Clathrus columnatus]|uniref:WD repeat-containing protein JIP5 n=1 Tax=Clathrus columnatus TaxID=1419009 RepID=A0AAV5AP36_9AGAM|nr:WD repeat-containing protein jip5 [Clathrus columnatus]